MRLHVGVRRRHRRLRHTPLRNAAEIQQWLLQAIAQIDGGYRSDDLAVRAQQRLSGNRIRERETERGRIESAFGLLNTCRQIGEQRTAALRDTRFRLRHALTGNVYGTTLSGGQTCGVAQRQGGLRVQRMARHRHDSGERKEA